MSSSASDSENNPPTQPGQRTNERWLEALPALLPLCLLAAILIVTFALIALVHRMEAPAGFFAQQQVSIIVLIIGSLLAIISYGIAIWRTLRRVEDWQRQEAVKRARLALWLLAVTALVVALPLLVALLYPQHPAP